MDKRVEERLALEGNSVFTNYPKRALTFKVHAWGTCLARPRTLKGAAQPHNTAGGHPTKCAFCEAAWPGYNEDPK